MMNQSIKFSVLMPVKNTPLAYLEQAVNSIICQTYRNYNFIIVDDANPRGPITDYLYDLTKKDCCISIIRKKESEGLAAALDFGLEACTGEIIVRMDSDDIASTSLLQKHYDHFVIRPWVKVCGVAIRLFSEIDLYKTNHPSHITKETAQSMPGYWFFNHPGCAYRREDILAVNGYGKTPPQFAEDYALWIKFLKAGYTMYNLPDVLIRYRLWNRQKSANCRTPEWYDFLETQKQKLND